MELQQLRERADLRRLIPASSERRDYGRYVLESCPFHVDSTPSLLIFDTGYTCKAGCGSGDVFNYFYRLQGLRFNDVARMILNQPVAPKVTVEKRQKKLAQDMGVKLHLSMKAEHFTYYREKLGLDTATVQQYHLGFGTFGSMHVNGNFLPRTVGRWTIPFYEDGKLITLKARRDDRCPKCKRTDTTLTVHRTDGTINLKKEELLVGIQCPSCGTTEHPDPEPTHKYISVAGAPVTMFNAELLWKWHNGEATAPKSMRTVFVTEGEYKALAICQLGYYAVSFGSASQFNAEWAKPFLAADKIFFIADTDAAGEKCVEKMKQILPQARVIRLPNPPKGDAVDYLKEHSVEEFTAEVNKQIGELSNNPYYEEMVKSWKPGKSRTGIGSLDESSKKPMTHR